MTDAHVIVAAAYCESQPHLLVQIQDVYRARPIDPWCGGMSKAPRPVAPDLCGQHCSDTPDNLPI
jgi:hypothetical protein